MVVSQPQFLWRLCFLNLSYSRKLIKTPDFTGTPNLEELYLEHCTSLIEVHESIGHLKRLTLVSFRSCTTLETLPQSFWKLTSLKSLDLHGCSNLIPLRLTDSRLQLQFFSDSQMIKAPSSIDILRNLVELDLSALRNLRLLSLKMTGSFCLPDTLQDLVLPRSSSEGKKSQEMVAYKK